MVDVLIADPADPRLGIEAVDTAFAVLAITSLLIAGYLFWYSSKQATMHDGKKISPKSAVLIGIASALIAAWSVLCHFFGESFFGSLTYMELPLYALGIAVLVGIVAIVLKGRLVGATQIATSLLLFAYLLSVAD